MCSYLSASFDASWIMASNSELIFIGRWCGMSVLSEELASNFSPPLLSIQVILIFVKNLKIKSYRLTHNESHDWPYSLQQQPLQSNVRTSNHILQIEIQITKFKRIHYKDPLYRQISLLTYLKNLIKPSVSSALVGTQSMNAQGSTSRKVIIRMKFIGGNFTV